MVIIEFFTDLLASAFSDKAYESTMMSQLPIDVQRLVALALIIFLMPIHLVLIIIGLLALFSGQWIGGTLILFLGLFFAYGLFKIISNIRKIKMFR